MASTDLDPLGFPEVFDTVLDVNDLPNTWAALLEVLAKRVVITFNTVAERDSALAGLGPSDTAYAFIEDKGWLTRWTGTTFKPTHPVWGSQAGTFTAGLATITHNLGFTPTLFQPFARVGAIPVTVAWQTGTTNTTTAVVRAWDGSGSAYVGTIATVGWVAYP